MTVVDLEGFRVWATGNLVDNRNRGIFAEWLVGTALGVVDPVVPRREWDAADLRFRERLIEASHQEEASRGPKIDRQLSGSIYRRRNNPGTLRRTLGLTLDPIDQLKKLSELHEVGILSDEEFEAKKRDLLDKI